MTGRLILISCGLILLIAGVLDFSGVVPTFRPGASPAPGTVPAPQGEVGGREVVLALSWHPAFCEVEPEKRECRTQDKADHAAIHFSLHGLWPEREFCENIPYSKVSDEIWRVMQIAMPGVASGLHKHEWEKHGVCYSKTPERYFIDSLRLVAAFNAAPVRALFERNIGKYLSASDIRTSFDTAFGRGAGDRVLVHCVDDDGRRLIEELRIRLNGDIENAGLPVLLKQARPQKRGCKGGIVDEAGLQG